MLRFWHSERKAKVRVVHAPDLQSSQQVAGLSQPGPGSIQLLQQFVLSLLQGRDLPLSCCEVLLPLLHLLLQTRHLHRGDTGRWRAETAPDASPLSFFRLHLRGAATSKLHQHFMFSEVELSLRNAFNNCLHFLYLSEKGLCFLLMWQQTFE